LKFHFFFVDQLNSCKESENCSRNVRFPRLGKEKTALFKFDNDVSKFKYEKTFLSEKKIKIAHYDSEIAWKS
jgi:hypothetical protein